MGERTYGTAFGGLRVRHAVIAKLLYSLMSPDSHFNVFDRLAVWLRSRNNCVQCCLRVAKLGGS